MKRSHPGDKEDQEQVRESARRSIGRSTGEEGISEGRTEGRFPPPTDRGEKVKEIEGVIFVPFTPNSMLRDRLQSLDEDLGKCLQVPSLRFVEKAGTKIVQTLGQSDTWASERFCPRRNCHHCKGRLQLLQEAEQRSVAKITGEATSTNPL